MDLIATLVIFVTVATFSFAMNEIDDSAYITAGVLFLLIIAVWFGVPTYCFLAGIATTSEATMMLVFGILATIHGFAVSQLQKTNKIIAELKAKITPPPADNKLQ